jgi:hypothetical protein
MKKKGDDDMQVQEVTEVIADRSAVLSLKQVHNYTDVMVKRGHAEYNKGSILVRSKHPMDQCLRRGIIEEMHHDIAKRIRNYRDCAVSKLSGRTYHATSEGDSDMDAATVYAHFLREMIKPGRHNQWTLIKLVCFTEPTIDGEYLTEADYAYLFPLAPNVQYALEAADEVIREARDQISDRIKNAKSQGPETIV